MNNSNSLIDRNQLSSDGVGCRNDEETLVTDDRALLTPSQIVEQKLIDMMKTSPLLVSHLQRRLKPGSR